MMLELHATPEEVMRAVEALRNIGAQHGVDERTLFGLALALEESGTNVVKYGLQRDPALTFRVTIEHTADEMVIELRDRGPEFDPTRAAASKPVNDESPGGWGIQLVRRYMDKICYRREAGENVLRLTKRLDPDGARQPFP